MTTPSKRLVATGHLTPDGWRVEAGPGMTVPAWEIEFDERFNFNPAYWQELATEIHFGDPNFNSVRDFIRKLIKEKDAEIGRLASLVAIHFPEATMPR